ncbi:UDP-N-acetylmuramate dehydrogenase [Vibrio porteresiae]|uniref:UDP-N-acetylenolpyruvoylglucosamine reductase n=1 Tax=Vibrio porteresiae DSM 19223 TaxID=1123496 RepID=A0ABZ0QFL4_9VIBR|nr:UDP-N-acetylmuramate dehydrogenase [Vibrio porteresiae]WPC74360.1 UDP-N-acetylmuramate dehydrogenase [Vibrio porteresiae DSM 19223]
MQFHLDISLKPYHTFGIDQQCEQLAIAESVDDLKWIYRHPDWQEKTKLIIGKGSNMLFTQPYQGLVIVNRIMGITHTEDSDAFYLHVGAGEDWPDLVQWSVSHSMPGLENLALIPGCAGSAPVQNIGAYGVEFKDVCQYVDYLCLESFEVKRLTLAECQFGYRDSVFKHRLFNKAVVVAVGLKLTKAWQPRLQYGPLKVLEHDSSAQTIYDTVCHIRQEKLPDPAKQGNAGSFFKNPVISQEQYQSLLNQFPDIVAYPAGDEMKVAAGWLIDKAGLKGISIGGARVHPNQALVIVNQTGDATAQDVIELAAHVYNTVYQLYQIKLEHEVRFMAADREVYLSQLMENPE